MELIARYVFVLWIFVAINDPGIVLSQAEVFSSNSGESPTSVPADEFRSGSRESAECQELKKKAKNTINTPADLKAQERAVVDYTKNCSEPPPRLQALTPKLDPTPLDQNRKGPLTGRVEFDQPPAGKKPSRLQSPAPKKTVQGRAKKSDPLLGKTSDSGGAAPQNLNQRTPLTGHVKSDQPANGRPPYDPFESGALLTKKQCDVIKKVLAYEKAYGTRATTEYFTNTPTTTPGPRTPLGPEFDNARIPTAQGDVDLDWFTDVIRLNPSPMSGQSGPPDDSYDRVYIAGKYWHNFLRWKDVPPYYGDPKEGHTLYLLRTGKARHYSDLFPPEFLKKRCGK